MWLRLPKCKGLCKRLNVSTERRCIRSSNWTFRQERKICYIFIGMQQGTDFIEGSTNKQSRNCKRRPARLFRSQSKKCATSSWMPGPLETKVPLVLPSKLSTGTRWTQSTRRCLARLHLSFPERSLAPLRNASQISGPRATDSESWNTF